MTPLLDITCVVQCLGLAGPMVGPHTLVKLLPSESCWPKHFPGQVALWLEPETPHEAPRPHPVGEFFSALLLAWHWNVPLHRGFHYEAGQLASQCAYLLQAVSLVADNVRPTLLSRYFLRCREQSTLQQAREGRPEHVPEPWHGELGLCRNVLFAENSCHRLRPAEQVK